METDQTIELFLVIPICQSAMMQRKGFKSYILGKDWLDKCGGGGRLRCG